MAMSGADLRPDCTKCVGLCCVAPTFTRSADFAIDKPTGVPCPHLTSECQCAIHDELRRHGFPGCVAYDCYGAGQALTAAIAPGDWRSGPAVAKRMFAAFEAVRDLHELLWHLCEAVRLTQTEDLRNELATAIATTRTLASDELDAILAVDLAAHRRARTDLLRRVSSEVRGDARHPDIESRNGDLIGLDLSGRDLADANFRGARLIGANLADCRLTRADMTGADLRGADTRGAELSEAIFLTQSQLESARGDARTRIPATHSRPAHW
jgi:hypothetical protein